MNFFVPEVISGERADRLYSLVKARIAQEYCATLSTRRIYGLQWQPGYVTHSALIGEPTTFNKEVVVAILYEEARDLYYVCTPNRGVLRGRPILIWASCVTGAVDFEMLSQAAE